MMDITKLRLKSILPPTPRRAPSSSGYSILDQFINQILPMVQGPSPEVLRQEGLAKREQQHQERLGRDQFNMSRMRPALPQIAQSMQTEQPEMRTVMQALNPYQEATLAMRGRELESRENLNKQKQSESVRKNLATEEDRARRTAVLEAKLANDDLTESEAIELQAMRGMDKQKQGQRFTVTRDETLQKGRETIVDKQAENAAKLVDKRGVLEKEYIALRNDNSKAAVERKAEIDRELAAENPLVPSQEKTAIQIRMNEFLRKNPEYDEFVSLDENGFPKITSDDPEIVERINRALGLEKKDINLPSDGEKKDEEKPPPGSKPGGKWIVTKSGKRIYQEPD